MQISGPWSRAGQCGVLANLGSFTKFGKTECLHVEVHRRANFALLNWNDNQGALIIKESPQIMLSLDSVVKQIMVRREFVFKG